MVSPSSSSSQTYNKNMPKRPNNLEIGNHDVSLPTITLNSGDVKTRVNQTKRTRPGTLALDQKTNNQNTPASTKINSTTNHLSVNNKNTSNGNPQSHWTDSAANFSELGGAGDISTFNNSKYANNPDILNRLGIALIVQNVTKMYTSGSVWWGIWKKLYKFICCGRETERESTDCLAVNKVSFMVKERECFGLLGTNGAGKSTTFKMLTGDIPFSSGNAMITGKSLQHDLREAQKSIGYCPQSNAIFDTLTTYEHLRLFAALRGIHKDDIDSAIKWSIDKLSLRAE